MKEETAIDFDRISSAKSVKNTLLLIYLGIFSISILSFLLYFWTEMPSEGAFALMCCCTPTISTIVLSILIISGSIKNSLRLIELGKLHTTKKKDIVVSLHFFSIFLFLLTIGNFISLIVTFEIHLHEYDRFFFPINLSVFLILVTGFIVYAITIVIHWWEDGPPMYYR